MQRHITDVDTVGGALFWIVHSRVLVLACAKNNYDDGGNIDGGNIIGDGGEIISICFQAKYTKRGIANLQKWIKLSGDLPGKTTISAQNAQKYFYFEETL